MTLGDELYFTHPMLGVTLKDCYGCDITHSIGEDLIKMMKYDKLSREYLSRIQVLDVDTSSGGRFIFLDVEAKDVVGIIESWKTRGKDQCFACGGNPKLQYDASDLTMRYQTIYNFCRECANDKIKSDIVEIPTYLNDRMKEWYEKEILKIGNVNIFYVYEEKGDKNGKIY